MSSRRFNALISSILLLGVTSYADASTSLCADAFSLSHDVRTNTEARSFEQERKQEPTPDIRSDLDYLTEVARGSTLGQIDSRFIEKWDTRIYYSATARAAKDGTLPIVNADASASVIFFHGSGTAKASGRNFAKKMNDLTSLGYFSAAFDMPFHGNGPLRPRFDDVNYFFKWLHEVIEGLRIPGKPLYLAGHSFGPLVIAEYTRRYPGSVNGILLISPVAFDAVTRDWYFNRTSKMKFENTIPNPTGGIWADKMLQQFQFTNGAKDGSTDISLLNPDMSIRILSGSREEFAPAPTSGRRGLPIGDNTYDMRGAISRLISRSVFTSLSGYGHQVLEHRNANGQDTIVTEILALDGVPAEKMNDVRHRAKAQTLEPQDELAQLYARDRLFSTWANKKYGAVRIRRLISAQSDVGSKAVLGEFAKLIERRREGVFENIKATQVWAPEFYARNRDYILDLDNRRPRDETKSYLLGQYFAFLQGESRNHLERHAVFSPE